MPCRRAFRVMLVFGLVALAVVPVARGQQGALDKVHYRDAEGKVVTVDAEIKESAAGVQLTTGTKALISPADVIRIDYGDPKGISKMDQFAAIALEENRDTANFGHRLSSSSRLPPSSLLTFVGPVMLPPG